VVYAISIQYPISLGLTKISILTFYLRIFPHEIFRKVCFAGIGFVVSLTLAISLAQAFICEPIHLGWSGGIGRQCLNKVALQYCGGILNLSSDVAILLLPLTASNKRRWETLGIFSFGFLVRSPVSLDGFNSDKRKDLCGFGSSTHYNPPVLYGNGSNLYVHSYRPNLRKPASILYHD
jgi:hypothetical protein